MLEHLTRQSDLIPLDILEKRIVIVGAGAIGSFVTLQLAKMGFNNLQVYDFDKVSVENMSCQFYRFQDIGKPKVLALKDIVWDFAEVGIDPVMGRFEEGSGDILISCVDSMESRKEIWKASTKFVWFIDPRMSALDASLYCAQYGTPEWNDYEKTIVPDDQAVQERCTAKSTMFTVNLISGLTVKTVVDCLKETPLISAQWSIRHNDLTVFTHKQKRGESFLNEFVQRNQQWSLMRDIVGRP